MQVFVRPLLRFYKPLLSRALVLFTCSCLCACGGGGDGSSGPQSGKNASTGVRLIHAGLDYPELQVSSIDAQVISSAKFGAVSYTGALASGVSSLIVSRSANPLVTLFSLSTDIAKNQRKSIFVYGGYQDQDLRFSVIEDAALDSLDGVSAFRVMNGIASSNPVSASIATGISTASAQLGSASEYVRVPAGTYEFIVSSGAGSVGRVSGTIEAGAAYTVVSYGAAGYFVTTNLLQD